MRFDHRPSKAPAAKDRTPQSPSRGSKGRDRNPPTDKPAKKRGSGVSWIILAMVLFTLAYGGILLVKIQQEREILITEAERSQANAAGYLAERVTARIAEARYALAFAAADLRDASPQSVEGLTRARLAAINESELVTDVALLLPGGQVIAVGTPADGLRDITGAALDAPSGLTAQVTGGVAHLILAVPTPLSDGTVGAFVARLSTESALPDWGDDLSLIHI